MTPHSPGFRILVLGIEGNEQRQAGLDGLGDVPDGPDRAQTVGEQPFRREALCFHHSLPIGLRLGFGELSGGRFRYSPQDLRVLHQDPPDQCAVLPLTHPARCPQEVFQHPRYLGRDAVLLQGQKFIQPRRCPEA